MVKDIRPGALGSSPGDFVIHNDFLYFYAFSGPIVQGLCRTDGTEAGTIMIQNIDISTSGGNGQRSLAYNGTKLLFPVRDDTHGTELWISDGTEAGTALLKDIDSGSASSAPRLLTNVNGTVFFTATTGTDGRELWKTDGTANGTEMLKDIAPGSSDSYPSYLTDVNGTLFFMANNNELWKSDGTKAGTVLVKDFLSDAGYANLSNFTNVNGTLFFTVNDPLYGNELWKSDGTEAGTVLVKDIASGTESSSIGIMTVYNGVAFFEANDRINGFELWKSDGTEAGTVIVKNILSKSSSRLYIMLAANNLYFSTADEVAAGTWKTDGTEAGTVQISTRVRGSYAHYFGSEVYFTGMDSSWGNELWKTDGTDAGTVLIKDIYQGTGEGSPVKMAGNNNGLIFATINDGVNGWGLWKSDGTPEGTKFVKVTDLGMLFTDTSVPVTVNGVTFFKNTTTTYGNELWKTDGTESGTVMVKDIWPGTNSSIINDLININGVLFFTANDGTNGYELWKSNGTSAGTVMVKDIRSGALGSSPTNFFNVNGKLFFLANSGSSFGELWKSDGTSAGTVKIKDIQFASASASVLPTFASMNGALYFMAYTATNGFELWKSDGTSSGTVMVKDIRPGSLSSSSDPHVITNVNGTLYFRANDGTNGFELWKSDGTEAGTVMVKDITPGSGSTSLDGFTWFKDAVYFNAYDGTNGSELWKSDGTDAGTVMVKDIAPGNKSSNPNKFIVYNNLLYFIANDGIHGREIWQSDGTEAGTVLVKDIIPGSEDVFFLGSFVVESGKLFFTVNSIADEFSYGRELWSLGFCTNTNTLVNKLNRSSVFNNHVQTSPTTTSCQCDVFNNLISTVDASGPSPFTGEIKARAWIESTTPATYVKRHYELTPATDITTATGKITLYFTQAEFNAYNAAIGISDPKLPIDGNDTQGISNLLIEKYSGTSRDSTGLPASYNGNSTLINNADIEVIWNTTANRWEVSFTTTGFGGFFITTLVPTPTLPTDVTVNKTAVCVGDQVTLSANCAIGTITWYTVATEGTAIGTGTGLNHSPTANTTYYAACEINGQASSRVATSAVSYSIIIPMPSMAHSVNKNNICIGDSITLSGSCLSGTPVWYTQATGGVSIGTGPSNNHKPATITTYYVACKYLSCFSTRITVGTVTVTSPSDAPMNVAVNKTSICAADPVILSATCTTGTVTWYNNNTVIGGTSIGTGSPLTQNPTVNTTYYAACQNNACESSRVAATPIVIAPKPTKPVITSDNTVACQDSATLHTTYHVVGTETFSINWTGGRTGSSIKVLAGISTPFKVSITVDGCASDSSDAFTLQVNYKPQSPIITANNMLICKGQSSLLQAQCPNIDAAFYWNTPSLQTNSMLHPMNTNQRPITEPGAYTGYCETEAGCKSDEVTITITQNTNCNGQNFITILPELPVICPDSSLKLSAFGCSGSITWLIGAGTQTGTSVTVSPTVTSTYMAQCSTGGSASVTVGVAGINSIINYDIATGKEHVRVTNKLESNKKIGTTTFTPAPHVVFEAGSSIILTPGFSAEKRSTFRAEIKACN